MKITINNLGKITESILEVNDFTILVGDNNSGKTYITYSVYGLLQNWKDFINYESFNEIENKLKIEGQIILQLNEIIDLISKCILSESKIFQKRIRKLFNDKEKFFLDSKVKLEFRNPTSFKDIEKSIKVGENYIFKGKIINNELTISYLKETDIQIDSGLFNRVVGDIFTSLIFEEVFPEPTIITAERLGISLFYKELDERKNSMFDAIQKLDSNENDLNPLDLILSMSAYYATPIRDHISYTRNFDNIKKNNSLIDFSYSLEIIKEILGAEFRKEDKQDIRFYTKNKKSNKFDIPLYLASSSARCIVDIYFYLKHLAKEGDILLIDEPESHLTLKNQRLIAKLLCSIVNKKIKVFITTHSDFLIKEINNLILLSNEFEGKNDFINRNKRNYSANDGLKSSKVTVYEVKDGTLFALKVDNKGIEIPFLDNEINNLFTVSNELEYLVD